MKSPEYSIQIKNECSKCGEDFYSYHKGKLCTNCKIPKVKKMSEGPKKCKEIKSPVEDYGQSKTIHERLGKHGHLFFYKENDGFLYIELSDNRRMQKDHPNTFDSIMYVKISLKKIKELIEGD